MAQSQPQRTHRARSAIVGCLLLMTLVSIGAERAEAGTLAVCPTGCVFSQIAPAIAAANPGDTLTVAAGTYAGGFTIGKNIALVGAGPRATIISGGGPVITVGVNGASTEPTVTIRGVTITGGATHSSFGLAHEALGGGVWVPPAANNAPGATVTITGSVITRNTVAPTTTVDAGFPCGPSGDCRFSLAGGGGIDSWGNVTLHDTIVSNNEATGPVTSDAAGAGIYSQQGTLTVENSFVTGNRATATAPDGRFAEGAGIMFDTTFASGACMPPGATCMLLIRNTVVSNNSASLTNTLPIYAAGSVINMNANSGGIHVGSSVPTKIENSAVTGNSVSAIDPFGEPLAFDAAIYVGDSPLELSNSVIRRNLVTGTAATSVDVGPGGSAVELDGGGTISNTQITENTATAITSDGPAAVNGGLAVLNFTNDPRLVTVQNSVISSNSATASSRKGSAKVQGAGIFNNSLLELRNVLVSGNSGKAAGNGGVAQGGGIWNGVEVSGPPVQLTLDHATVTHNELTVSAGLTAQGGGLFTTSPVTFAQSVIRDNTPDDCSGTNC